MPIFEPTNVSYEIKLVHPNGYYLKTIDTYTGFDYTLVLNDIGVLTITLPGDFPLYYLIPDARLEVWRQIGLSLPRLEGDTQFIIQIIEKNVDDGGNKSYKITAHTLNSILKRRVVAYNSDAVQAFQVYPADNMIKGIFAQNFGSDAVDTARNISSTISLDDLTASAPSVTKDMAYKNVLDTCKEIAETSWQLGTPLFFEIICDNPPSGMRLRTWTIMRGTDRRASSGNPLLLGFSYGSIGAYTITTDYSEEGTFIYALGPGEGSLQLLQTAEDTTRSGRSLYGRRELVVSNNDADTSTSLLHEAKSALVKNRPRKVFVGKLFNTPKTLYGVHWNLGDYVTADADEEQFDCHIAAVHVSVTSDGEDIDAALRNDNT